MNDLERALRNARTVDQAYRALEKLRAAGWTRGVTVAADRDGRAIVTIHNDKPEMKATRQRLPDRVFESGE